MFLTKLGVTTTEDLHQFSWGAYLAGFMVAVLVAIIIKSIAIPSAAVVESVDDSIMPTAKPASYIYILSPSTLASDDFTTIKPSPVPNASAPAGNYENIKLAAAMVGSDQQFSCLKNLWLDESGFRTNATNSWSGAYGIPQALPAAKMASAGPDWRTNPTTQIRWGLSYIDARYGSPCSAWNHFRAHGNY